MEELKKAFETALAWYSRVVDETRETATAYLKAILETRGGEINNESDLLDGIGVTYDGGNHPEYASSVVSVVKSITIKGDTIMFALEDEDDVNVDRITTEDLVYIVDTLSKLI